MYGRIASLSRSLRGFCGLCGVLLTCATPSTPGRADSASAAVDPAAAEFVGSINRSISQFAAGGGRPDALCIDVITSSFDFDAMARVTSVGTWDGMSPAQRTAYRAAFLRRAGSDCALRVTHSGGEPLTLLGIRMGGEGDRLIATQSTERGQRGRVVVWRVRSDGGRRLRAVDVIVDGRSMVVAVRDDAKAILARGGGPDALIQALGR
jgi:ABC-type transporter MlaC component